LKQKAVYVDILIAAGNLVCFLGFTLKERPEPLLKNTMQKPKDVNTRGTAVRP